MLIHAFSRNYQRAILVAGDSDYVGLLQDLKRLGTTITGMYFDCGALSSELRLCFDEFIPLTLPNDQNVLLEAVRTEDGA